MRLATRTSILIVLAVICLRGTPGRAAAPEQAQAPAAQPAASVGERPRISVAAGRSTVLETAFDITRISVNNPAIAEANPVTRREVLVDGKSPGTISLIVWGADTRVQYDLVVEQPVSALEQQLRQLFPGEDIQVTTNEGA